MEMATIFFAMLQCIVKVIYYVVVYSLIAGVVGVVLAGVGVTGIMHYKRGNQQTDDQDSTDEDDFEESYAREPGTRLITTTASTRLWRELDSLNDEAILENTKDL